MEISCPVVAQNRTTEGTKRRSLVDNAAGPDFARSLLESVQHHPSVASRAGHQDLPGLVF